MKKGDIRKIILCMHGKQNVYSLSLALIFGKDLS